MNQLAQGSHSHLGPSCSAPEHPGLLTADSPLWAWAYEAIGERAEGMLTHVEGVRLGEDIEAVHDMRVASRRLVAAMRVFEEAFPTGEYARLLKEARRVTRLLGAVRDLDVLIDYYATLARRVKAPEALGIAYLSAALGRSRKKARRPMLEALDRTGSRDLPGRLRRHLQDEAERYGVGLDAQSILGRRVECPYLAAHRDSRSGTGDAAAALVDGRGSFREAAPVLLFPRYEALYAFEPYVHQPDEVERLHEMRIAAKWLRYTMELFAPAYSDRLKTAIDSVKRLQELLGDLHDSDVRRWLLRDTLAAPLDARGLEPLGLFLPDTVIPGLKDLRAREERTRRGCYRAFYKQWTKLARQGFADSCLRRIQSPDAPGGGHPDGTFE